MIPHTINFCTTVKNRTWQLRQTLPKNIEYIRKHNNTKILILNYNTEDDLTEYLTKNYKDDLLNGNIEYYILEDSLVGFDMSLAKNLIHKQSKDGVVFNLDADNFIDDILISELNRLYPNEILIPIQHIDYRHNSYNDTGRCGRLGLFLSAFKKLNGYDESIKGLGADDGNLVKRAWESGINLVTSKELSLPIENEEEHKLKNLSPENRGTTKNVNPNGYGNQNIKRYIVT